MAIILRLNVVEAQVFGVRRKRLAAVGLGALNLLDLENGQQKSVVLISLSLFLDYYNFWLGEGVLVRPVDLHRLRLIACFVKQPIC